MAIATPTVSLKLLIDATGKKVVFAETDKAFVDFLFNLMSLPIGTVIKLVGRNSMVGSLGNLYGSISDLNDTYIEPGVNKNDLLNPKPPILSPKLPLLMPGGGVSQTKRFYLCHNSNSYSSNSGCCSSVSDDPNSICPKCKNYTKKEVSFVSPVKEGSSTEGSGGFVKGVVTYMVMDDLKVIPHSTISAITVLNEFNIKDFGSLQEKRVVLGVDEGLKLLVAAEY